jgi:K+-transporting ATPase ATPase B chain
VEDVPSSALRPGDEVVVSAGEVIPADGTVIEGIASVDESAITGESAPVIRESGGDRSAVTGGTRVLSDQIVVLVTAQPGESFLDRMIALVEGAERQKTPNEIALNILLAGLTIVFLLAVVTLQPFAIYSGAEQDVIVLVALLVCLIPTTIGGLLSAIGIAGMDRLVRRNVLALSGRAVEAARSCSTRPGRSRSATARRQNSCRSPESRSGSSQTPPSCRASPTRRPRADPSSCSQKSATGSVSERSAPARSSRSPPKRG